MELTELQKKILNAPEDKIAVIACAAALKTSTMTEKVRQLLKNGTDPTSIAVITFTRMAAQELIDRLGDDYKNGLFVGTIHSLAAKFIANHGQGDKINKIAEEENFDKLFDICEGYNLYHAYDWVFIDECQDTGEKELRFIFDLLDPEHYFCCLDFNQSIYAFRGARPDLLKKYLKKEAKFYSLNENYRNGRNILKYAKDLLNKSGAVDNSIAKRDCGGSVYEGVYNLDVLVDWIESIDAYNDWVILCRTNSEISEIQRDLEKCGIPTMTFKQGDITKSELDKMLKENKVKVLTVHSSKGLAWNNVVVYGMANVWHGKNDDPNEYSRLQYVAATRAKNSLIWLKKPKKKSAKYF